MKLRHLVAETAFPYADIEEDVFIRYSRSKRVLPKNSKESIWVETGAQKLAQFVERDHFDDGISAMCIRPMPILL